MEFFKKYGALLTLAVIIAVGFYNLGLNASDHRLSTIPKNITNATEGKPDDIDFAPFWKAWNLLNEKYVPASTTDSTIGNEEKLWGAIEGLASSLGDPYTVFFPPVESELFESEVRGNFEGVGMEILAEDGVINVISPLKNSPAERAGMEAGDKVIRIEDKPTSGLSTEDAVKLIRGPSGTKVKLTVFREGVAEPFEVSIVRAIIDIPIIATESLGNGIFKIELYSFSANSPNLFRQALREFILSGDEKLILDMRGNPGGYLEAAIDMASWFLPPSKVVVREDFGPTQDERVYRSRGYDIFNDSFKFIILVDKGSASASEILAGALQEHGKAVVVGEQTFGKGSVQELVDITSDTSIKITVARWLTPNGLSISETGVTPDHVVEITKDDRTKGRDPQLEKAIEVLTQ